jgi:hypothetical protein
MHALPLMLLVTIVPAPTPVVTDNPTYAHEISLPWDLANLGQPGTITRVVAGDVTGDLRPDVFARGGASGSDILFMYAPVQGVSMIKLAQPANDFDIAVGDGPNGVDVLVIVGADGLRRMVFSGTSFVADSPVGGNWLNAQLLRCGNVNATGGVDYVGVKDDASRDKLIYRRENGTESVITTGHAILDVQLLHWGAGATLQAAVMSAWGVEVYNLETGLRATWFENGSMISDAIAVVHVGTAGPDRLMFASHLAAGTTLIKQLKRSNPSIEDTPVTITGDAVVAMAACPANAGAGENLIVSFAHARTSLELTNQNSSSSAPLFSLTWSQDVGIPVTPADQQTLPANQAVPIYRDMDNDGLADVLLARSDAEGTTFELFTDSFREGSGHNVVPGAQFFLVQGQNPTVDFPNSIYQLPFLFPTLEEGSLHIEITVWRQNHNSLVLDPIAVGRYLCPLPTEGSGAMVASNIPIGTGTPCLTDVRWLEIRQVHWDDVLHKIVKAGPTYTAFIAGLDDWTILHPDVNDYPYVDVLGPPPTFEVCTSYSIGPWPVHQQSRRRRTDPPYPQVANPGPLIDCTPTNACASVDYID